MVHENQGPASPSAASTEQGRITPALLVTLALLAAIAPFATDLYLPAFPAMVGDLHTTATGVQLTLTTFLLGLGLGQLLFGPMSDRFGRVKPLVVGSAICVAASVTAVFAPTIEILVGARFVQGFTGAAGMVIGRAIISDLASGRAAAQAFSLMMMVGGIAPVLAPLAGGFLVAPLGWRGTLGVVLAIATAMLLAILAVVKETHTEHRRAEMRAQKASAGSPLRDMLGRTYIGNTVSLSFAFAALMAYISASPFIYQTMMGLSATEYGMMFGLNAVGLLGCSTLSARLVATRDLGGLARVGLGALLLSSAAVLVLALTGAPTGWLALPLLTAVSSMGLIFGNTTALALGAVPRAAGTASAVLGASQFLLAALVSPLVTIGGEATAVPAGIVMVAAAAIACVGHLAGLERSKAPAGAPDDDQNENTF